MTVELHELEITPAQLEQVTGLDISPTTVQGILRPGVWQSQAKILSVLLTQGLFFSVIFILCMGLALVIFRGQDPAPGTRFIMLMALGITGAIAIGWHTWLWQRGKQLRSLMRLLAEVDRHNDIIQAIQVMDELDAVQSEAIDLAKRQQLLAALRATRESLMSGLMTERILRKHQKVIARRQELFATIETNLATLQALQLQPEAHTYRSLLQEALEIGLIVQQEIQ